MIDYTATETDADYDRETEYWDAEYKRRQLRIDLDHATDDTYEDLARKLRYQSDLVREIAATMH